MHAKFSYSHMRKLGHSDTRTLGPNPFKTSPLPITSVGLQNSVLYHRHCASRFLPPKRDRSPTTLAPCSSYGIHRKNKFGSEEGGATLVTPYGSKPKLCPLRCCIKIQARPKGHSTELFNFQEPNPGRAHAHTTRQNRLVIVHVTITSHIRSVHHSRAFLVLFLLHYALCAL